VSHAGFWGTYVPDFDDPTRDEDPPTSTPTLIPNPCVAYDPGTWVTGSALVNALLGIPVQMFDGGTAVCTAVVTNRVPGTDVLVIRHAQRCLPGEGSCEADATAATASKVYLQGGLCEDDLEDAAGVYEFARTPTGGAFAAPFDRLTQRDCTTPAPKRRYVSYIYWVRDFAAAAGDGIPTLVRSEFDLTPGGTLEHQPPLALVEGVDGLWVEFGIDDVSITGDPVDNSVEVEWEDEDTKSRAVNRGDGIPDGEFVRCTASVPCDVEQLMNVTAVKMYVVARSREETRGYTDTKTYGVGLAGTAGPYGDAFKRHVYATTVRLPNVSGRRERP
jgi:type IV pilus assembly protein PilW